ncbi:unnamed protein product, partial [Phaeothamnion confervicola]
DDVTRFQTRSAFSVNLLTYACSLAAKNKKEISIDEFCKLIELNIPSTLSGNFGTMWATGLIARTAIKDKERTYVVSAVKEEVSLSIYPYITDFLNGAYRNDQERLKTELARLERVTKAYSA